jgi:2-amino-4-hydroxy-6-hydroxymethyldihydropteridine diphosphokinase
LTEAFVGLGSNVGDRLSYLRRAVVALRELGDVRVSSVYETEPVGPPQDLFLNAVAVVDTVLRPQELLDELKRIESSLGRIPRERWGPREIDLDLLLYGDQSVDEPLLTVPHPELTKRAFVLVPLSEIAPDARLPDGQILAAFLQDLDVTSVRLVADGDWISNQDDTQRNM